MGSNETIHTSEKEPPMLNTLALNVKTCALVKRAKINEIVGRPIQANYLYIRAIDLHVPQQTLNA